MTIVDESLPGGAVSPARERIASVDILRGLVMVIMVLDHVRDFFGDVKASPTNLDKTTYLLFFTRWITHYCAPTFVFLAGTGAYFSGKRRSKRELSPMLLKRGLMLMLIEVTVVRFGMTFDPTFAFIPLTVIWAIGLSMVVLSALVFLPVGVIAAFGSVLIVGHNLFDDYKPTGPPLWVLCWQMLHQQTELGTVLGRRIFGLYPLVPWVGVMSVGYALGALFELSPNSRRRLFLTLGLAISGGFVVLRASNLYGDPTPWTWQERPGFTLLSFLNLRKYPPSLLYLMMTLGPALVLLGLFEQGAGRVGRWLETLGREPLFYYILQWYLIHIMAIVVGLIAGKPVIWMVGNGPFSSPDAYGYSLSFVYLMWVVAVGLLWWTVQAYSAWKRKRKLRHA